MARVLIRNRIQEHINRVLKEDMLSACNRYAELRAIECSILLHGSTLLQGGEGLQKKASNILQIICGQAPTMVRVDPGIVDPALRSMSEQERKHREQQQGVALMEQLGRGTKKNQPPPSKKKVITKKSQKQSTKQSTKSTITKDSEGAQFRAAKAATQFKVDLHGYRMYYFLDKLMEFHLPEVLGTDEDLGFKERNRLERGHDNWIIRSAIAGRFDVWTPERAPLRPFRPIRQDENPVEALTTYTIPLADLIRFPDIESNFEALNTGGSMSILNSDLSFLIRPTIGVTCPVAKKNQIAPFFEPIDNLLLMNWFLGCIFNPYLSRPYHSAGPPLNKDDDE